MDAGHHTAGCWREPRWPHLAKRMLKHWIAESKVQLSGFIELHLKMLDPYVGFGDAVTRIPKINSPWGSGLKTAILKRPRSGAKRGPPRHRAAKWTEILGALQTTSPSCSRWRGGLVPDHQLDDFTSNSNIDSWNFIMEKFQGNTPWGTTNPNLSILNILKRWRFKNH